MKLIRTKELRDFNGGTTFYFLKGYCFFNGRSRAFLFERYATAVSGQWKVQSKDNHTVHFY